jgi:hypothetical protein
VTYAGEVWVDVPAGRLALAGAVTNPSPRNLAVAFTLASAEPATLGAFDLTGRRVATREVGSLAAGAHVVELGAFAPGVSWLRLAQGDEVRTAKAVVR